MTLREAIDGFEMDNVLLFGKEEGIVERNIMAIKALEVMDSQRWIPVEEQLPEEEHILEFPSMKVLYKKSKKCLVTFQTEINSYIGLDYTINGEWVESDNVTAWMFLPEPFNPQN